LRQIVDETVSLNDLTDTSLQTPIQNNQILRYDSTESKWKNVDLSTSGGGGGGSGSGVSFLGELTDVTVASSNLLPDQSVICYSSADDEWQNILIFQSTDLADGTSNNITLVPQDQGTVKVASNYKDRTEFDENALTPKGYVDAEVAKFSPISPPNFPDTQTLFLVTTSGGSTPQTSIGNSPKLCSGVMSDNSLGQTPPASAGESVLRIPSGVSLHTNVVTAVGPGNKGTLTAIGNGVATGLVSFTNNDDSQTSANLIVSNNLDFPEIFPGFHMIFDAQISNWQPDGLNEAGWGSLALQHSETSTLETYFVIDDMTANPAIVNPNAATLTQQAEGTLVYITGIPHYSTGSSVALSGLEMSGVTGETYYDGYPLIIHTNESSSGVASNNKTYQDLGASGEMINNEFIPSRDIGFLTLNSIVYTIDPTDSAGEVHLAVTLKNPNGTSTVEFPNQKILLSPENQPSGNINEITGLQVASGLGNQPNSTDALRGVTGSGDTPDIDPTSSFDHNLSLVGDLETAVTVGGVLQHSVVDYSGSLPSGPDLTQTPGRAGKQYATYKFQRTGQQKMDIQVVGKLSGLWLKLPGVTEAYTSAGQNGWYDTTKPYFGFGIPGINGPQANNDQNYGCSIWNANTQPLQTGQQLNQTITCTFGALTTTQSQDNYILLRVALQSGESVTNIQIKTATN